VPLYALNDVMFTLVNMQQNHIMIRPIICHVHKYKVYIPLRMYTSAKWYTENTQAL
jgi:hypothetical protein